MRVDSAGRVQLPPEVRQQLGIAAGHDLVVTAEPSGIRLQTFAQAAQEAKTHAASLEDAS